MKKVMVRAWEIAKAAVVKHGGKAVEYIAGALKMAWAEVKGEIKKATAAIIKTSSGSRNHKSWVAEITGKHPKFKFNREFLEVYNEISSLFGGKEWKLLEGKVYEVCDGGNRYFAKVENGEVIEINGYEVSEMFA
nr:hypothetical protein [Aneurinibacillus sp. XH2]